MITLAELFSDTVDEFSGTVNQAAQATKIEAYKAEINKALANHDRGAVGLDMRTRTIVDRSAQLDTIAHFDSIDKAMGGLAAEQAAAIGQELAALRASVGTINKDWTPSSPVSGTGLTPYDLEAPAKVLVPRDTPLRNSIPRVKGQGNARKFKRIDSFTNAGIPGGAATASPFFASATNTSTWGGPGNLTLNRPNKISYTGSDWSIGYVELGFSDSVTWQTQFQGLGFDDVRGLSHTALLYSHLLGEERAMLYGRGSTGNGYSGIVNPPSGVTTGTATTGGTIAAATYFVYVVAYTGFGQSAPSTVVSQVTTGAASTITVTVGTEPTGALYYGLYVGTTTGIANTTLQTTFTGSTYVLTSYGTSGVAGVAADSSFSAQAYDGFLTVQADPTKTGYLSRQNAAWSALVPGKELDTAFNTMYVNNGADPDEVWMSGAVRASFGQLVRAGGASGAASGYRTNVVAGANGVTIGTIVTGFVNSNTNKVLDVKTHRFMPPGAVLIRSLSLPVPDSNVSAPVQAVNVQDYMAVDWPTIQMTYDASTYQIGTLEHIAPAWNGLILGVWSGTTAGV